jgi:hypothetical protein
MRGLARGELCARKGNGKPSSPELMVRLEMSRNGEL